jgi:hypothetical protein
MRTSSPNPSRDDLPALPYTLWNSGYDWIGALAGGWYAVPSWGRSGWDLGAWPLVIIAHYDHPASGCYGLAVYVEGDLDVTAYPTREARDQATNPHAAYWWRVHRNGPNDLPVTDADLQPHHTGPFSWSRCQ